MLKGLRISMCVHYGAPNLQGDNVNKVNISPIHLFHSFYIIFCYLSPLFLSSSLFLSPLYSLFNQMACSGALVDEGNYIVQCAAGGQILITTEAKNQLITGTNFDAHIIESFSAVTIPSHRQPLFVYEVPPLHFSFSLSLSSLPPR